MIDLNPVVDNATRVLDYANSFVLAQEQGGGPLGPEFGKASPIGMLVLVVLLVAVLTLGWNFSRRWSKMNRRRLFAEKHGLDPFDIEGVEKAMAEAGLNDREKKTIL